jgi:hypothetical protein
MNKPFDMDLFLAGVLTGSHAGGVRNFVFGHNMSKRCMYANQKETRVTEATENPKRAA